MASSRSTVVMVNVRSKTRIEVSRSALFDRISTSCSPATEVRMSATSASTEAVSAAAKASPETARSS
jgi:hypothetical protein